MFNGLSAELAAWSKLFREQFQVLLMTLLFISVFFTVVHAMHHGVADQSNLAWIREIAGTVGGVLWGIIKGVGIGRASGDPTPSVATTTIATSVQAAVPPIPEAPAP